MTTPLWASADVFQNMTWTAELEILKNGYVSQVPYTTKIWIETSEVGSGSLHVTCTINNSAEGAVPVDTVELELLLVLKAKDVETGRELLDWRAQVTEEAHDRGVFDVYGAEARMEMATDDPLFAYVDYTRFPRFFKGLHATIPALGVVQTLSK